MTTAQRKRIEKHLHNILTRHNIVKQKLETGAFTHGSMQRLIREMCSECSQLDAFASHNFKIEND